MSYYIDEHHEIYVYWKNSISMTTCTFVCVLHVLCGCATMGRCNFDRNSGTLSDLYDKAYIYYQLKIKFLLLYFILRKLCLKIHGDNRGRHKGHVSGPITSDSPHIVQSSNTHICAHK